MMNSQITSVDFNESLAVTKHAQRRMSQRNISRSEIEFIVAYGKIRFAAGAVFFHLRKKDIPKEFRRNSDISRLEGTTVVASSDNGDVMTVYRNRSNGLQGVKQKV